ncbi:GGDEF domain-containing protein [Pseudomonas zhanjiangensis]|uniref:diguanylate cyclase n=1 Tax=Pseudomonas zhanjiangensis TaxID=3239015 RepID=A0ABV3YNY7_9PSED
MKALIQQLEDPFDFRQKATLGVALAAFVLLTPFSINHIVQGHPYLGTGSLIVVLLLAGNAWGIWRGHYSPALTLLGIVPAVIFYLVLTINRQGIIGVLWCYPAVISFYFMLPERKAWIANGAMLALTLPQAWSVIDAPLAARVTATLLAVSAFAAVFIRVITAQQHKMRRQAVTDPLTGLFNRMLLADSLEQAIEQSRRTKTPMALLSLDIDHFKAINDRLGHDAGDAVLRGVGELLHQRARRADKLFRLGGEEFLVLLYDADGANARQVAEELLGAVAAQPFLPDQPVTVSIGAASLVGDEDYRAWMKRVDENLYRAKSAGRNRVVA